MTTHEMWILAVGVYLGFIATTALHVLWVNADEARAARARQAAATAALKRAVCDQYLSSFLTYRLIHGRGQA